MAKRKSSRMEFVVLLLLVIVMLIVAILYLGKSIVVMFETAKIRTSGHSYFGGYEVASGSRRDSSARGEKAVEASPLMDDSVAPPDGGSSVLKFFAPTNTH